MKKNWIWGSVGVLVVIAAIAVFITTKASCKGKKHTTYHAKDSVSLVRSFDIDKNRCVQEEKFYLWDSVKTSWDLDSLVVYGWDTLSTEDTTFGLIRKGKDTLTFFDKKTYMKDNGDTVIEKTFKKRPWDGISFIRNTYHKRDTLTIVKVPEKASCEAKKPEKIEQVMFNVKYPKTYFKKSNNQPPVVKALFKDFPQLEKVTLTSRAILLYSKPSYSKVVKGNK